MPGPAPSPRTGHEWYNEGKARQKAGDPAGALDAFRTSLKLNPRVAAPWAGLADILEMNQQPADALECLKRGVAVEPNSDWILNRLARAHHSLGQMDDAKRAYERALSVNAHYAPALLGLGQLFEDKGEPEAAAEIYRRLLTFEPQNAEAISNIVGLGRQVNVSEELRIAEELMETSEHKDKALIGYGLGKALDRLKRYDDAFAVLAAANAARRKLTGPFDPEKFDERLGDLINIFSPDFFAERANWGSQNETPVFIVSLPRSGTTLTEQIIGSHPACFGAGELGVLADLATGTPDRLGDDETPWPQCAPALTKAHVDEIGADYVRQVKKLSPSGKTRLVDKQPLNFWQLGLVAIAMPKARIIHCTRDIRDVGNSIFSQNFNVNQRWSTDLSDIAHYWRGYRRLMAHWRSTTNLNMIDVSYEDTVTDLEGQARRLLDFLGLPWDDNVLAFHKNDRAVQTPSRWQVRQPLYATSKAKWRNYEAHLGPLIEAAEKHG